MQQLAATMTAQEFAQHHALELHEPAHYHATGAMLAALANGPLKPPDAARLWSAQDFAPAAWQGLDDAIAPEQVETPITVTDIMARARMAGMVQ